MLTSGCRRLLTTLTAGLVVLALNAMPVEAATQKQIDAAIRRGVDYLKSTNAARAAGHSGLAAYAVLKSGGTTDSPFVQECLEQVLTKFSEDGYRPQRYQIYEAGVDLMALEAADPQQYLPQMRQIAVYIVGQQRSGGQWFYPGQGDSESGDTSITQYALLGLWAAERAGVPISDEVWDRAARWHMLTQFSDGGAAYHPHNANHPAKHSTTAASVGSMELCRRLLPLANGGSGDTRRGGGKKFGFLAPSLETAAAREPTASLKTNPRALNQAIERGRDWLVRKYNLTQPDDQWAIYYLYGIERLVAIGELDSLGGHDWYADGADFLVRTQRQNGSWYEGGSSGAEAATSFALLFLSRATSSLITPKVPDFGGGLQVGGRGLTTDRSPDERSESESSVDRLLDDLLAATAEASERTPVAEHRTAALIEQVQQGDRQALIERFDLLAAVVVDDQAPAEVRQTAAWALGRTGKLQAGRYLLDALEDDDWEVVAEAHRALCVLSRRPAGEKLGVSLPTADDEQAEQELRENWRKSAVDHWTKWYLQYRPYEERDDRFELEQATR